MRIQPVGEIDEELRVILSKTLSRDGQVLNIFRVLAKHRRLLKRWNLLGGLFLADGVIPTRDRELVILRVGWRSNSVYEFGQHTLIGMAAGLTVDEITHLAAEVDSYEWNGVDSALIALVDEMHADNRVSDETWAYLAARWNEMELIELVMLVGFYRMVSGFLNAIEIDLEPGTPNWPCTEMP